MKQETISILLKGLGGLIILSIIFGISLWTRSPEQMETATSIHLARYLGGVIFFSILFWIVGEVMNPIDKQLAEQLKK